MLTQLKKRGFRYLAIKFFSLAFQQIRAAIFSTSIPSGKGLRVGKIFSGLKIMSRPLSWGQVYTFMMVLNCGV